MGRNVVLCAMAVVAAAAGAPAQAGPDAPPVAVQPPPLASPPPIQALPEGNPHPARPMGNPGSWVTSNDYPSRALREAREGSTTFKLEVSREGLATGCLVTESSGSADLDAMTCSLMMRRARFHPATDADGNAIEGSFASRMRWIIPKDSPVIDQEPLMIASHPMPGQSVITFTVGTDGRARDCLLVSGPDPAGFLLWAMPCDYNQIFPVYRDAKGNAVARKVRMVMSVSLPTATQPARRKKR